MKCRFVIDGVEYSEAQIKRALDLEKEILSPGFVKDLAQMIMQKGIADESPLRSEI